MAAASFSVRSALGEAIADLTGQHVLRIEVVHDSQVEGTWAVQAVVIDDTTRVDPNALIAPVTLQFLVKGFATPRTLSKVIANDLEEVEFTAWPPTSGGR